GGMTASRVSLPSVAPARLREVAGSFATGVTVITTTVGAEPHGCTANAVTSLSLEPPLMLVCLHPETNTHPRVIASRFFAINILRGDAEGKRVCRIFAGDAEAKFHDVKYRPGATGAPILAAALSWLECELEDAVEGGDHTIFMGRVVGAELGAGDAL